MNLDEAQRKRVAEWIAQGLKLSDIQNRLAAELGVSMTYMDVRLLVDDLKLVPKDAERPKPAALTLTAAPPAAGPLPAPGPLKAASPKRAEPPGPAGKVSVAVDQITRAGAVVSGKVTFSDGNRADWFIDQTGRLGLAAETPGYRPAPADVEQFQIAMESELAKLGF
jgi:hypothetical protein